jgi:hydroxymethylglutaryl-CoA reductase
MEAKYIQGFSKLSKEQKVKIISEHLGDEVGFLRELNSLNHKDPKTQAQLHQFSENTIGNFPLPYGIAPNFLINDRLYTIPMVTEESSVVAAASSAAHFWSDKGGFVAKVRGTTKIGQIHFCWHGDNQILVSSQSALKKYLIENTQHLTKNMVDRGGGITNMELIDFTALIEDYYQLRVSFETSEVMGANFINTVLEDMSSLMKCYYNDFLNGKENVEIIMAILSNYTPDCIVECYAETTLSSLENIAEGMTGKEFARKCKIAVDIATIDTFRAVTHNKGIFNGIDAVILATANDFRAVEAAGHAYAARSGKYSSLSKVELNGNNFRISLEMPMSVGTIGGLTSLHPMAKWSFGILNNPNVNELMMIIASAGLACNFSAIRSLVTSGIQKGHMKMHLGNILTVLGANEGERIKAFEFFRVRKVTYRDVEQFLKNQKSNI